MFPQLPIQDVFVRARLAAELEYRILTRLSARPGYATITENRRVAFMKRYDDAAYETFLLRQELKAHVGDGRGCCCTAAGNSN